MRINLQVPFIEKDTCKRLGGRWDVVNKTWYIEDKEDLTPFMQWMRKSHLKPHEPRPSKRAKKRAALASEGTVTPQTSDELADCGYTHVAPWDDCEHSTSKD